MELYAKNNVKNVTIERNENFKKFKESEYIRESNTQNNEKIIEIDKNIKSDKLDESLKNDEDFKKLILKVHRNSKDDKNFKYNINKNKYSFKLIFMLFITILIIVNTMGVGFLLYTYKIEKEINQNKESNNIQSK